MTLRELLTKVGFRGAALDTAIGVARAESGGNAKAHNPNAGTGDNSYGLFQINMLGAMGPARRAQYGLASNEALYDPETNAKVAYAMSGGGTNWSPWSTFKNGAYRALMGKDVPVTGSASSGPAGIPGMGPSGPDTPPIPGMGGAAGRMTLPQLPGLPGLPGMDEIGNTITKVLIIGTGVIAGAGLVLLGLNKVTGNPAGKAASLAI